MARRSRGRSAETSDFANLQEETLITELLRPVVPFAPVSPLSNLDNYVGDSLPYDRRAFSFGDPEPYQLGVSSANPLKSAGAVPTVPSGIGFREPDRMSVCVRRQVRKEVLHALRRAGGGGSRLRRRNEYSNIRCK